MDPRFIVNALLSIECARGDCTNFITWQCSCKGLCDRCRTYLAKVDYHLEDDKWVCGQHKQAS